MERVLGSSPQSPNLQLQVQQPLHLALCVLGGGDRAKDRGHGKRLRRDLRERRSSKGPKAETLGGPPPTWVIPGLEIRAGLIFALGSFAFESEVFGVLGGFIFFREKTFYLL